MLSTHRAIFHCFYTFGLCSEKQSIFREAGAVIRKPGVLIIALQIVMYRVQAIWS